MNILFLNDYNVTLHTGGIASLTMTLARGFKKHFDHNCYLAFMGSAEQETVPCFDGVLKVKEKTHFADLQNFIKDNSINVIISTLVGAKSNYTFFSDFYYYIRAYTHCKLFWIYLNRPDYDVFLAYQLQGIQRKWYCGKLLKDTLNWLLHLKIVQPIVRKKMHHKFSIPYHNCDKVIVLSPGYIPMFYSAAQIKNNDSIVAIGNPLVFEYKTEAEEIKQKGKHVLIVARFDESAKRLCLALKIWESVEQQMGLDWDLTIIGFGVDENLIKNYAKTLKIKNVHFVGQQNPIEYYKRSSIYMMTSKFEGFPLVLNDAKQFGMVPIVFNTFEAANDLIRNEESGILIDEGDVTSYKDNLIRLMSDASLREKLATKAVSDANNYTAKKICSIWNELFEEDNE